jgi:hypothetical protein
MEQSFGRCHRLSGDRSSCIAFRTSAWWPTSNQFFTTLGDTVRGSFIADTIRVVSSLTATIRLVVWTVTSGLKRTNHVHCTKPHSRVKCEQSTQNKKRSRIPASQCEGDPEHYVSIWLAGQLVKSTGCQGIITADAKELLSRFCQKLRAFPVNDIADQSGSRQKDVSIPKSTA